MSSIGNSLLWCSFFVVIFSMLSIDLLLQKRQGNSTMSFRQAVVWSLVWVCCSILFDLALWWYLSVTMDPITAKSTAISFFTGYLIEKSLAVDNVFVWLIIFNYFSIPLAYQRRVLVYGVLGAIVLRAIMIFAGSWLVTQFQWILYLFGAFLLLTGFKMFFSDDEPKDIDSMPTVKWLRRHLNMTEKLEGHAFFVKRNSMLYVTPLFFVLCLVELSDIIFAVDSIPAIFAITTDPFIVLTSNLFAILGLRAMYFLLAGSAERFSLLKYGLAVILSFIGIKMLIAHWFHIPILVSLLVVISILVITILINYYVNVKKEAKENNHSQ